MRLLLLIWCLAIPTFAVEEQWFVGTLGGQPLVSLRQVTEVLGDGRRQTVSDMLMIIRRTLPGQPEFRMELRETQSLIEQADGTLVSFRFDHDENGSVTTASGTVGKDFVDGVLARLGRTTRISLPIPANMRLLGDVAAQQALAKSGLAAGATTTFTSLGLISNQVTILTSTATARGHADGRLLFEVVADAVPLPMQVRLLPSGELAGMTMNLGVMVLELKPSAGPVALRGAELPPTGLVVAAGPTPGLGASNRLRIPAGVPLPADPFQHEEADLVTVRAEAPPSALTSVERERYLAATPQFELDDPGLREWVLAIAGAGGVSERAERLRLAVRSHITIKDLTKGDGSALETFRSRRGDCTEHAALLAAALRIAGVPARVEVGLVFAPDYGGWVGHAWNQAYDGQRWIHLDSAYPGIVRSRYLGLGFADGLQTGAALMVQLNRFLGKTVTVVP